MSFNRSPILVTPIVALATGGIAHAIGYLTLEQAMRLLFPNETLTDLPLALTPSQVAAVEKDAGTRYVAGNLRAWRTSGGGYLYVDEVIGKHDLITYALALNADGAIRDVEILDYRESYGGEIRNAGWRRQFNGRRHGDPVRLGRDIRNISGATLSSQHVTDGIRRVLAVHAIAVAGQ